MECGKKDFKTLMMFMGSRHGIMIQSRAEQSRAEQSRAEQSRAEQSFDISEDNPWLRKQYKENNWKEQVVNPDKRICYIFISGNG